MRENVLKVFILLGLVLCSGCVVEGLDQNPIDPDSFTEVDVFKDKDGAKRALAKLYSSMALTGQKGPDGQPDIKGIDEGSSQYTRMYFYLQEVVSDHVVIGWGDPGVPDLNYLKWTSDNAFVKAMYYRLAQVVSFCNSFIENAQSLKSDKEVAYYIAEARFIRAYAYSNLIDFYGAVPLVTKLQTALPKSSTRAKLFEFVESELKEVEPLMKPSNEYGRVDKTAVQALLSRLYLNAKVYTGTSKYDECIAYSKKVMASGYKIHNTDKNSNGSAYDDLFLADNDKNGAQQEFIFVLNFDGLKTQTWGGTSFLVHAAIGGTMDPKLFGVNGGWAGIRTTKQLVSTFEAQSTSGDPTSWKDKRALFHHDGQKYEISDVEKFKEGYAVTKFKNVDSSGKAGSHSGGDYADTDLPMLRLAEVYLNYAEAVLRGGNGGSRSEALRLVNVLRERAYGDNTGNIADGLLTLDWILDERGRELYWEGLRRTDLIRYGKFTSDSYLWAFKGGVKDGAGVSDHLNLYPIPVDIISINKDIKQNKGY